MARTSFSLKQIALPLLLQSKTSCAPSVNSTPTNLSPSRNSTAIMPEARGRENSFNGVFLTVPFAVAKNTNLSSSYSRIGNTALMRSSLSNGNKLIIGRPRAVRPACGTSNTFNQYTLPLLEKHKMVSWVLATNNVSTKSSSLTEVAALPRPPRRCAE